MRSFPAVTVVDSSKPQNKIGFEAVRTKGSHKFLRHSDGRCTVVPVHAGETIGRGLLAQIMRDCEISPEDLNDIL